MEEAQEQAQDGLAGEVMESVGEPSDEANDISQSHESETTQGNDPLYVQKRLKQQKRAHEREMREMQARIAEMNHRLSAPQNDARMNPYANDAPSSNGIDEQIHKAVSYALQHKEMEERKAREAQSAAHIDKKYQDFQKHLDGMSDKYDDFDDVVMAPDAKFTPVMRDYAARTMAKKGPGSAGEVLYHLGKNPELLDRIRNLHPDDQAEELHTLSLALAKGGESKSSQPRPLGQIKSNPVHNSHAVTEKTPIGSIRQRMKAGNWK